MLVYIREDCQSKIEPYRRYLNVTFMPVEDVLCDINQKDIPENLITRFDYDK